MSDKWDLPEGHTHSEHSPEHLHRPQINHAGTATGSTLTPTGKHEDLPPIPKYVEPAQKPSIGRIVHFVLPDSSRYAGEHRPAIIVKVWDTNPKPDSMVQLQVFTDGLNDGELYKNGLYWATSVHYADPSEKEPATWHWPERV